MREDKDVKWNEDIEGYKWSRGPHSHVKNMYTEQDIKMSTKFTTLENIWWFVGQIWTEEVHKNAVYAFCPRIGTYPMLRY